MLCEAVIREFVFEIVVSATGYLGQSREPCQDSNRLRNVTATPTRHVERVTITEVKSEVNTAKGHSVKTYGGNGVDSPVFLDFYIWWV